MNKEMTCNEFLKAMKEAGFYGKYRATNGDLVITGEIKKSGEVEQVKHKTSEQSRAEIKQLFKGVKQ